MVRALRCRDFTRISSPSSGVAAEHLWSLMVRALRCRDFTRMSSPSSGVAADHLSSLMVRALRCQLFTRTSSRATNDVTVHLHLLLLLLRIDAGETILFNRLLWLGTTGSRIVKSRVADFLLVNYRVGTLVVLLSDILSIGNEAVVFDMSSFVIIAWEIGGQWTMRNL
ncbi:MAG: hypothetical protein J3R72DRAFT_448251 [Linnemannia gamsii]|nr:MAG: hypothetical protein J3R72DRAFT_448251 [Linnemannia gamsii]